jgi:hypothetical protein
MGKLGIAPAELPNWPQDDSGVTPVVEDHVRPVTIGPREHLVGAPPVLLE